MTTQVFDSFGEAHEIQRGLRMEREWTPDGQTEVERRAYIAVRFVPVYDAKAVFALERVPSDLSPYQVGFRAVVVP